MSVGDQTRERILKLRADQTEEQLKDLWKELDELTKLFGEKCSKALVEKLQNENEALRQEIELKKNDLLSLEKQHKVPQILNTLSEKISCGKQAIPNGDAPTVTAGLTPSNEKRKQKANKSEKQTKPAPVDVSRLDFRVGRIVTAKKHPDADTLYVEDVDVGEEKRRTVVSGLVKNVPLDEMQNCLAVLLCNLKPVKMRGVVSEAMVMCAVSQDKTEILKPPAGAIPGDLVDFQGYQRNPDAVLSSKHKVFESVQPDLSVDNGTATYKGIPWTVAGKGVVVAPSLKTAIIK